MKRALVSQTRMPETDRDSGSRQIDWFIRWLLADGWSVTFVASEENCDMRHAHRLRQIGVATFAGYGEIEEIVKAGDFDIALLAFWQQASKVLPVLREHSPRTRVLIDSVDLHFLRDARRTLGAGAPVDERYGQSVVGELNAYSEADAVLTVSEKESALLADFLGPERKYDLPLAEPDVRSSLPFEDRKGILFVGNFRHLPNGEAVEYLCRDILPRLDPELLAEHPLSVIGSRLDEKVRAHGRGLPAVRMIGWVPQIEPYLQRARVCVVPVLHGAGVKRKVVMSLMSGTPVLTTPIGAEGLHINHNEHALIAEGSGELAAGLARLLTDREDWERIANAGHELVRARHDPEEVGRRFLGIVEEVRALPVREGPAGAGLHRIRLREVAYRDTVAAVKATLRSITDPGSTVLVVSRGDEELAGVEGRNARHFPESPDGKWAGYHPVDSEAAIRHLEALRDRGARYFAIPSTSFWWLHHYREFAEHLETDYKRIHSDEHLVLFDVGETAAPAAKPRRPAGKGERVLVVGTYRSGRAGPPPSLVADLERSDIYEVTQRWRAGDDPLAEPESGRGEADWTVFVSDEAVVPSGFLDDFLTAASQLVPLGVERVQPPHANGPDGGPPVTERVGGILAREVDAVTPLPLLAVRSGAAREGPVALVDAVPITLAAPIATGADPNGFSNVRDVFVARREGAARAVRRSQGSPAPVISVVIATYERPELLAECLQRFCEQTLPAADFELVVVDDGSGDDRVEAVVEDFAARLPLTWARIEHAGRAAAKNLGVLLARGELMLFFDDDDWPTPELLTEHVRAHQAHPGDEIAILGRTDWAPELTVTPLMHYLTEVDQLMFSYGNLEEGERMDWRGFWEGRVSSKRSFHLRHGLHDHRLDYSIDVEMAWRLARHGLEVVYEPRARSFMARAIDFDGFCQRQEAKGRANAAIATLHDDPEIIRYTQAEGAAERWEEARLGFGAVASRIAGLEQELGPGGWSDDDRRLSELHQAYRTAFAACNAKGIAEGVNGAAAAPRPAARATNGRGRTPAREPARPKVTRPAPAQPAGDGSGDEGATPALTVTMPVWSRTPELAEMAARTIERVWEVARLPTELVVIDNGSPEQRPLRARVHRFEENRGVATAWNTGFELARAPVVAVLNSDCQVEPGWDEALYEAATTGRRIAFPYTDHCDGLGYRRPDQAGTAGWCFMFTQDLYREIGPFDERFNPAYVEDTDYWHRAWELGIELTPVPDARVVHARRTSSDDHSDWLLTGHRYLYGWKHGVEPMRAPPYYNREIVEYHRTQDAGSRATTT
jgi:glycosyltransferase involved in cell wall biosynthesis